MQKTVTKNTFVVPHKRHGYLTVTVLQPGLPLLFARSPGKGPQTDPPRMQGHWARITDGQRDSVPGLAAKNQTLGSFLSPLSYSKIEHVMLLGK